MKMNAKELLMTLALAGVAWTVYRQYKGLPLNPFTSSASNLVPTIDSSEQTDDQGDLVGSGGGGPTPHALSGFGRIHLGKPGYRKYGLWN